MCHTVFLSGSFLRIGSLVFLNLWMAEPQIVFKRFFSPKNGENGPKILFFLDLLENLIINFFWIWSDKESWYYLLYSYTNEILAKSLIPEIWAKMLSVNRIAGFLNWLYLQNKMMKKPGFLHVDTHSQN